MSEEVKEKKKLGTGAKVGIIVGVIVLVLAIVVGAVVGVLFGGPQPESQAVTVTNVDVKMFDTSDPSGNTLKYYIGTQNELDLTKAFPGAAGFAGTCGVSGNKVAKAKDGNLTFNDKDGNAVSYKVYAVDAFNAFGESAETDMRTKLKAGTNVVLHGDLTTTGEKATFQIAKGATLYGNGNELHADSISAPRNQKKSTKTSWGAAVFSLADGKALHIQDLHIFVNTPAEGSTEIKLEDFEFSGNGVDLNASVQSDGKYAMSTLTNVVIENGQKLLHVAGADVTVDGCLFRNGADANIASGTYAKKGANITIKNSVSMNSMVAGFLFYGWENVNKDTPEYFQTLNIEGFFDIYNWKGTDTAKLVPATEGVLSTIVNGQVQKEINNPMFDPYIFKYDLNNDGEKEKYIHIGIIRLSTGSCTKEGQNPTILYEGKPGYPKGYALADFPLPGWVQKPPLDIVKRCDMISYDAKGDTEPDIKPNDSLKDSIYKDMAFGRVAK